MSKSYHILLSIILYSLSYGVEAEAVNAADESFVNEKFKFIQDIYSESWALIIGINRYQNVEPLTYAVDDAEAVRLMLMDNYGFKDENIILLGETLVSKLDSDVLVTRGEYGMSLFMKDGTQKNIPTIAKEVYDVTGAGDTVVATLALAISSDSSLGDAAEIANYAAGIVVSKSGTSVAHFSELIFALNKEKLAYAGLDVFENEPNPTIHLLKHNAISLSPHIGGATLEAQARIGTELASQIINYFNKTV